MKTDSIKFKGHRCFKNDWVGFDEIKPINVIIGRNNSGKSHLLDLVCECCRENLKKTKLQFYCKATLDEDSLKTEFKPNWNGGDLGGEHWLQHGKNFIGEGIEWKTHTNGSICELRTLQSDRIQSEHPHTLYKPYLEMVSRIAERSSPPLSGKHFRHLVADRDVTPENSNELLSLSGNGIGATNIIRKFITSSDPEFPRELVQETLLDGLSKVFGTDGQFIEIASFNHDHDKDGVKKGAWETYLTEIQKGAIPLSNSGSGLKTVLLVLLNLIVIPKLEKKKESEYVFAFEELENNLHPALLRRLFQFLETYASKHDTTFFLTTHSSVALDFFGLSKEAQIIHVKHDGESASASVVSAHFDKIGVVAELGAKPSDLLQANGIIWVEGPSDRIYINHWIELLTDGELQEGRDYQCAFYGGSLLAKVEFSSPEEEEAEQNRVNLLRVNPNICVICDGDRTEGGSIKDRVRRISGEVKQVPDAVFWATKGREIENYVPGSVMEEVIGLKSIPNPGQYECFFPRVGAKTPSFLEARLNRKTLDKTQFAVECVKHMTLANMRGQFDWEVEMTRIVKVIQEWNS